MQSYQYFGREIEKDPLVRRAREHVSQGRLRATRLHPDAIVISWNRMNRVQVNQIDDAPHVVSMDELIAADPELIRLDALFARPEHEVPMQVRCAVAAVYSEGFFHSAENDTGIMGIRENDATSFGRRSEMDAAMRNDNLRYLRLLTSKEDGTYTVDPPIEKGEFYRQLGHVWFDNSVRNFNAAMQSDDPAKATHAKRQLQQLMCNILVSVNSNATSERIARELDMLRNPALQEIVRKHPEVATELSDIGLQRELWLDPDNYLHPQLGDAMYRAVIHGDSLPTSQVQEKQRFRSSPERIIAKDPRERSQLASSLYLRDLMEELGANAQGQQPDPYAQARQVGRGIHGAWSPEAHDSPVSRPPAGERLRQPLSGPDAAAGNGLDDRQQRNGGVFEAMAAEDCFDIQRAPLGGTRGGGSHLRGG